jgi:hypothetical protein
MAVVDRLIGFASPTAALRRSIQLKDKGQLTEAFRLLAVAAKAGIAEAEHWAASGNPCSTWRATRRSPHRRSEMRGDVPRISLRSSGLLLLRGTLAGSIAFSAHVPLLLERLWHSGLHRRLRRGDAPSPLRVQRPLRPRARALMEISAILRTD